MKNNLGKVIIILSVFLAFIMILAGVYLLFGNTKYTQANFVKVSADDDVDTIVENLYLNMENLMSYKEILTINLIEKIGVTSYTSYTSNTTLINKQIGICHYEFYNRVNGLESSDEFYEIINEDAPIVYSLLNDVWEVNTSIIFDHDENYKTLLSLINNNNSVVIKEQDNFIINSIVSNADLSMFYNIDNTDGSTELNFVVSDNYIKEINFNIKLDNSDNEFIYEYFDLNEKFDIDLPFVIE